MISPDSIRQSLSRRSAQHVDIEKLPGFTRAAVLIPLFPSSQGLSLLLTKRTDRVETHKGQISFPGGMVDASDADLIATALRETEEELGIPPAEVEVLGTLDDHPVPSQFIITPVVGFLRERPSVTASSQEVADVFEVPLDFFRRSSDAWMENREFLGQTREVWHYLYEGRVIWGATAAIIRNLLQVVD